MWNKIGEWLDYPEDWCKLAKVLGLYLILFVVLGFWYALILLPYLHLLGFVDVGENTGVTVLLVISILLTILKHYMLKDTTKWYPKLLSRIPSCPKINWNKGE